MDPKVCGGLLTHHRKGNGVDVDALRGRIPLRQITGKAPRLDLMGTEAPGGGKVFSWLFLVLGEYLGIYRPKIRVRRPVGGPQARGRPPLGRAQVACHLPAGLHPSSPSLVGFFWSKKNHPKDFILFGLHLIFLIYNTKKQGKNRNWHLALGTRLIG